MGILLDHDDWNIDDSDHYFTWKRKCPIYILCTTSSSSCVLHWTRTCHHRQLDCCFCELQAIVCMEESPPRRKITVIGIHGHHQHDHVGHRFDGSCCDCIDPVHPMVFGDCFHHERSRQPDIILVLRTPARLFLAVGCLHGLVCHHSKNNRRKNFQ